jgi:hypothetical protein
MKSNSSLNTPASWKNTPKWLRVVFIVAILNFASFWIIGVLNGGDAINGKEEGGKYFLNSHGHYTAVSKTFFDYSAFHALTVLVTHMAAFFGAFWLYSRKPTAPA